MRLISRIIVLVFLINCVFTVSAQDDKNLKVALVTGASGGIGQEIVRDLSANGFLVVAHYFQDKASLEKLCNNIGNNKIFLIHADLANSEEVMSLWAKSKKWKGSIDVLVNNASVLGVAPITEQYDTWKNTWSEAMQVNLLAPAILSREAVTHFKKNNKRGIIINIASRAASIGFSLSMHYAASKAGLVSLTKSLAEGYAGENIYAYAIAPGFVDTKMQHVLDQVTLDKVKNSLPTKQFVPPKEIANIVTFLALGKSLHATGTTIDVDGASSCR